MNNLGLEIVFWTVLTLYILTKLNVFRKRKYTVNEVS